MRIMFKRQQFFGVAVLGLLLSGCASSAPQLEDIALTASPKGKANNKGIVIVKASLKGTCAYGNFIVARKEAKGYVKVKMAQTGLKPATETAQMTLEAGDYHIVNFGCQVGRYVLNIGGGRYQGAMFNKTFYYSKSFASFSVKAGEVTNIGFIQFFPMPGNVGLSGRYDFKVTDLPKEAKNNLKAKLPKLSANMVTHLMLKRKIELSSALKKLLCNMGKTDKKLDPKAKASFKKLCS